MTPLEELTESFHKGANKVYELAQLLQLSLDKIQSIICKVTDPQAKVKLYDDECAIIQAQLSSYDESFSAAKNFITTYTKKLDTVLSVLSPTIRWLPEKQNMMEMSYQEGVSPWHFTLVHSGADLKSISSLLEDNFSKGILQSLPKIATGDFVCCYERKMMYRAMVLSLLPSDRVKVLNVDNNHKKIVKKDNIFDLTVDLLDIPAQCIQCCILTDNDDARLWNEDLSQIFKTTLSECRLSVNVIDRIDSLPPKFLIELCGYNDSLETEAILSEWILQRVLPELRQITDRDSEDFVSLLREEAIDPFYSDSERVLVEEIPTNQRGNGEKVEEPISKDAREKPNEESERDQWFKEESVELNERYPDFDNHIHQKGEPNLDSNMTTISDLIPKNVVKSSDGKLIVHNTIAESNELGAIVTAIKEEISQDETNICQFYKKNRYCWKPSCPKTHKTPPTKN